MKLKKEGGFLVFYSTYGVFINTTYGFFIGKGKEGEIPQLLALALMIKVLEKKSQKSRKMNDIIKWIKTFSF